MVEFKDTFAKYPYQNMDLRFHCTNSPSWRPSFKRLHAERQTSEEIALRVPFQSLSRLLVDYTSKLKKKKGTPKPVSFQDWVGYVTHYSK